MKYIFFLLLGFVICVNLFFLHKNYVAGNFLEENITGDASHYLEIAKNLKSFGVYSDNNSSVPTESATWRPPFYPFLLSVFLFISDNVFFLILLKVLFQVLLVFLGCYYLYINKVFSKSIFAVGCIVLIEPYYLKYSYSLLSESISASLLFLFFCFFLISIIKEKYFFLTGFMGFLSVINHPVVVFFIFILLFIVFVKMFLMNKFSAIWFAVFFLLLILIWPVRNYFVFNKGLFLTASQGSTFSKGWNEKVVYEFNNVDGDLADEGLNLKYLGSDINPSSYSVLDLSKLYKSATVEFIKINGWVGNVSIAKRKILSNFIPFPEKPKEGLIELSASIFRCLYLLFGVYAIFNLIFFKFKEYILFSVYLAVYFSQTLMSIFIYTGLRFNSVYNLVLFFVIALYFYSLYRSERNLSFKF